MNPEPELSIDSIIDELTALSAEREREAIRSRPVDGSLSCHDPIPALGMARGIMQAVRHIESMRRQAANERAHVQAEIERVRMEASIERVRLEASIERTRAFYIEMGNDRGPRKRDGDV